MGWFNWFTRDKLDIIMDLVKKAGKIWLGTMAQHLWNSAKKNVGNAESAGGSGEEKFKMAYEGIANDIGPLKGAVSFWAKIFIETFVLVINENKMKFFNL